MSLKDKRPNSSTIEQQPVSEELQVDQLSPVEQLPFPEYAPVPAGVSRSSRVSRATPAPPSISEAWPQTTHQLPGYTRPPSSTATRVLPEVTRALPEVTRVLPELQTGTLPTLRSNTTSLRKPVVIRSTGKKSTGTMRPPQLQGRRMMVHLAVMGLLAFTVLVTLLAVAPTGGESRSLNPFAPVVKYFTSKSDNTALLVQQAATATAVTTDGFDAGPGKTFAGVPTAPPNYSAGNSTISRNITPTPTASTSGGGSGASDGDGNHFFYGQCTWWAAYRYHQLTGHYPPWLGNAGAWAYGASAYGWVVSGTPRVPSIIVLAPGVQGAGDYGHVAVVESINADGSVNTSNFNWGAGHFGVETMVTFFPGPGVSFVWYP